MRKHILLLAGISLLWGSGWVVSPMLASIAAPHAASALVFALAACVLAPIRPRMQSLPFSKNLLLGTTLFTAPTALLLLAGRHGISGWIPLLYSFMPLFLAFGGEGWTPATLVAPGTLLVLLNGTVPFTPVKLLWTLPALVAVALQAWSLYFAAAQLRGRAWPRALAVQLAIAGALLGCASFFLDPRPPLSPPTLPSLAALAAVALPGIALPYAGLFFLLQAGKLRPDQVAVTQWLQTLFAGGESAMLLRAHPSGAVYAAGGALLVCTWSVLGGTDAFSE